MGLILTLHANFNLIQVALLMECRSLVPLIPLQNTLIATFAHEAILAERYWINQVDLLHLGATCFVTLESSLNGGHGFLAAPKGLDINFMGVVFAECHLGWKFPWEGAAYINLKQEGDGSMVCCYRGLHFKEQQLSDSTRQKTRNKSVHWLHLRGDVKKSTHTLPIFSRSTAPVNKYSTQNTW